MTGPDDQEPTVPAGSPTAGDLAAMVRVLEQRCRDAEGQARLAEEGRRRFEQLHQQQLVQTDIAVQHRREAEDAYQQVRSRLGHVAAALQRTGSPIAEVLATYLLVVVSSDAESASKWPPPPVPPQATAELASRLEWLVRTAELTRSRQRREWLIRGLCVGQRRGC